MNKTMKRWIAALRGGKYAQAQGKLRRSEDGEETFCCLGVLCDVVEPDGWNPAGQSYVRHGGNANAPTHEILDRAGVKSNVLGANSLITLNDRDGRSFEEIADALEEAYGE